MKQLRLFLALIAFLLCGTFLFAHDFEVGGIYYNIISSKDKTVEVTYKGNSYSEYKEYSNIVSISKNITYNKLTYRVTSIGDYAFSGCSGLTSIEIPNSVESIGYYAFHGCSGLTSVTIPNSVTNIGDDAFESCDGLKDVHISDLASWCNINFESWYSNPFHYADHLYLNGEEIKDLVIPDNVTSIGNYAFFDCDGLTSVTIPNSVTNIGDRAFDDCDGLTSVTIPNSVTNIGKYAFSYCI